MADLGCACLKTPVVPLRYAWGVCMSMEATREEFEEAYFVEASMKDCKHDQREFTSGRFDHRLECCGEDGFIRDRL